MQSNHISSIIRFTFSHRTMFIYNFCFTQNNTVQEVYLTHLPYFFSEFRCLMAVKHRGLILCLPHPHRMLHWHLVSWEGVLSPALLQSGLLSFPDCILVSCCNVYQHKSCWQTKALRAHVNNINWRETWETQKNVIDPIAEWRGTTHLKAALSKWIFQISSLAGFFQVFW